MPFTGRRFVLPVLVVLLMVSGCNGAGLPSPTRDMATGQALLDLHDMIVSLREENAMIQAQVDSLRDVAMRQDSVLRQVAIQSGITLPPP